MHLCVQIINKYLHRYWGLCSNMSDEDIIKKQTSQTPGLIYKGAQALVNLSCHNKIP